MNYIVYIVYTMMKVFQNPLISRKVYSTACYCPPTSTQGIDYRQK
jgi:hypothetical protein